MRRWLGVSVSAIVTHASALTAGFVWLDHAHLEGGLAIASPSRLHELFTRGFAGTGYYRPLTAVSLSLDAIASGPLLFHVTSILWHALASVLVIVAAEALGLARRAATIAAVIFAVHPVTALVADAIAFRSEAMVTAALLLLVWAHRQRRPVIAALAILAAALSKETGLVLAPLFFVALELGRAKAEHEEPAEVPISAPRVVATTLFVAEAIALGVVLALRAAFAPAWRAGYPSLSTGDAVGTRLAAFAKSVAAMVLPIDRNICDAFPVTHAWQPAALAGGVALAALAFGAYRRRGPTLLLALSVLPSLQLVPVSRWWSPHYMYLPLVFAAMLAAEAIATRSRSVLLASRAALAVLGLVTLREGRRFASDATLWTPEIAVQPACREGQLFLGDVAQAERRWELAAKRYEAALAPWPGMLAYVDRVAARQNLGVVRASQRRFREAREAFSLALEEARDERTRRELTHDLAAATLSDGDAIEAARLLEEETARPDALPASIALRALALHRAGRHDEARALESRVPK